MTPVARLGGRVLLVDDSGHVLLIHERLEDGSTHWLTPGGGVEDGEQPREAAERETREETGVQISIAGDAEPVLMTRRDWSWAGVDYDQVDHFFLVRVPDGTPVRPWRLTDVEQQNWLDLDWWSVEDLARTDAAIVPPDLATVLARVLRARPADG
jgi:8-oxo-dGTP pyrophosphatase MutT (NUDIX family)